MTTQERSPRTISVSGLRRFVSVEPHEAATLLASLAMFFALLSAYYIIPCRRPFISFSPADLIVFWFALKAAPGDGLAAGPLFACIALFAFFANVIGTFFYLEQARLVALTIPESVGTRRAFFCA